MYEFNYNYETILRNAATATAEYFDKNHIEAATVGMSGGIDSTLVAAIMYEVKKIIPIKFTGMVLDINSKKEEIERGTRAAQAFCNVVVVHDLSDLFRHIRTLMTTHSDSFTETIRQGNLKARLRMMKIYDDARANNGLVLSTDNYTELLLGFWTLHGDVGDLGIIQNLWKTEVYGLARFLRNSYSIGTNQYKALDECINAMPTDGLGVSNSDFDQIAPDIMPEGTPQERYNCVDIILRNYISNPAVQQSQQAQRVINRYMATQYKRDNPFNFTRTTLIAPK